VLDEETGSGFRAACQARQLGQILGVPVTHLDAVFYAGEWNELPREKFTAAQHDLTAARPG
jgi:hypothetical protein